MEEFPYDKIVKLSKKIENMKDKKYKNNLKHIKTIIETHNPDLILTKNINGYFATDFEKLNYSTYVELTKYFELLDSELTQPSINKIQTNLSDTNSTSNLNSELLYKSKKLKYTNSETHIINKLSFG